MHCSAICILCNESLENCWHVLLTCDKASPSWHKTTLWNYIEPYLLSAQSFGELFFQVCKVLNEDQKPMFLMVLWSIWKARNEKLWNSVEDDVDAVLHRAAVVYQDWQKSKVIFQQLDQQSVHDNNAIIS